MPRHILHGLLLMILSAAAQGAVPPDALRGRVLDEAGRPLAGVRVIAWPGDPESPGREPYPPISTGEDGQFAYATHPRPTAATVIATQAGRCLAWGYAIAPFDGQEVVLHLGLPATIEGVVVDENAKPIANATVEAILELRSPYPRRMAAPLPGDLLTLATDAGGRFRFTMLPANAHVGFRIGAPGRACIFIPPCFRPDQPGLRLVLPPEGSIEGTVTDESTGEPLPHVWVCASTTYHRALGMADESGRFRIGGLAGGIYSIEITPGAGASARWFANLPDVKVTAGQATPVRLQAANAGTLEVVAADPDTGQPVHRRAMFIIATAADAPAAQNWAWTSSDGIARVHLPTGDYAISETFAFHARLARMPDGAHRVTPGSTTRVALPLKVNPPVQFMVTAEGEPVAGAMVRILSNATEPAWATTNVEGRCAVRPLLKSLVVASNPRTRLLDAAVIDPKDPRVLMMRLDSPRVLSGAVRDLRGKPIPRAEIEVTADDRDASFGIVATSRTDQRGYYQVDVPACRINYAVTASSPGYSPRTSYLRAGRLWDNQAWFELLPAERWVAGRVLDPEGKPLPGAVISANVPGGLREFPRHVLTGADGRFTLDELYDAEWITLTARDPARGWTGVTSIRPDDRDPVIQVGPARD